MKKIIQLKLKFLSKLILKKYQPKIVGITGSVGKTSTKEATYIVLKDRFKVRKSERNYNNEFGLPLTIIGSTSPGRNIFGWLGVFLKACFLLLFKSGKYPEILILEMGIDHPGDMDYLTSIARPDVGVVTMIGPVHLEFFQDISQIAQEKGKLIVSLKPGGVAILNADNELCLKIADVSKRQVLKYGIDHQADIFATQIEFQLKDISTHKVTSGTNFALHFNNTSQRVMIPSSVGKPVVYAALAASLVATYFKIEIAEVARNLSKFNSQNGRMKLLEGVKQTLILDDTYNASPQSAKTAIEFLSQVNDDNLSARIAVFGDMLELGSMSKAGHESVGEALAQAQFDLVVTVGDKARGILEGAKQAGMSEDRLFGFDSNDKAGRFVQKKMKKGDLVLVKGSQGARMEQIVKEIMADPLRAEQLLVRQDFNPVK